jgi:hypothetical protein
MSEKLPGMTYHIISCIKDGKGSKETYDEVVDLFGYSNTLKAFRKTYSRLKRQDDFENFFSEMCGPKAFEKSRAEKDKVEKDKGECFCNSLEDCECFSSVGEEIDRGEEFIKIMKKRKIVSGEELCETLGCTPKEVYELANEYRIKGYEIYCDDKNVILSTDVAVQVDPLKQPLEDREIVFAVMSDLHFGSKSCQITAMNEFAEICRKKGIRDIFIPGDIFAGYGVFPGQQFEVYALSADEQEQSAIVNLPQGFQYYGLGGNHDYSFIKRGGGHNPLVALAAKRPDFHYLGFDEVDVPILPGVSAKLWHPDGGLPYSLSYKLQKAAEQVSYNELQIISRSVQQKPTTRFLFAGHLHVQVQALIGPMLCMQCGCFEGQSGYLKKKMLLPTVGGYIVKADLRKKDGLILNFEAKFYVFPDDVENDWKNYKHTTEEAKKVKPVFQW